MTLLDQFLRRSSSSSSSWKCKLQRQRKTTTEEDDQEFLVLSDPERLAKEGVMVYEAKADVGRTLLPRQLQQLECLHKNRGRVLFSLEELPLRKVFLTSRGSYLERLSYRYVSYGKENYFLRVTFKEPTLDTLPKAVLERVWKHLDQQDRLNFASASRSFRLVSESLAHVPVPVAVSVHAPKTSKTNANNKYQDGKQMKRSWRNSSLTSRRIKAVESPMLLNGRIPAAGNAIGGPSSSMGSLSGELDSKKALAMMLTQYEAEESPTPTNGRMYSTPATPQLQCR